MGTHPSGPATVIGLDGTTLSQWLNNHPSALGDAQEYFGNDIPFLFKVRSFWSNVLWWSKSSELNSRCKGQHNGQNALHTSTQKLLLSPLP